MDEVGTGPLLSLLISSLAYHVLTRNSFKFNDQLKDKKKIQKWETKYLQLSNHLYALPRRKLSIYKKTQT